MEKRVLSADEEDTTSVGSSSENGPIADRPPKRQLTAYNIFFQRERRKLLISLGEEDKGDSASSSSSSGSKRKKPHGRIGFADLARTISAKWKATEDRSVYLELAAQDKVRYQTEMKQYKLRKREEAKQAKKSKNKKSKKPPTSPKANVAAGSSLNVVTAAGTSPPRRVPPPRFEMALPSVCASPSSAALVGVCLPPRLPSISTGAAGASVISPMSHKSAAGAAGAPDPMILEESSSSSPKKKNVNHGFVEQAPLISGSLYDLLNPDSTKQHAGSGGVPSAVSVPPSPAEAASMMGTIMFNDGDTTAAPHKIPPPPLPTYEDLFAATTAAALPFFGGGGSGGGSSATAVASSSSSHQHHSTPPRARSAEDLAKLLGMVCSPEASLSTSSQLFENIASSPAGSGGGGGSLPPPPGAFLTAVVNNGGDEAADTTTPDSWMEEQEAAASVAASAARAGSVASPDCVVDAQVQQLSSVGSLAELMGKECLDEFVDLFQPSSSKQEEGQEEGRGVPNNFLEEGLL